MAKDGNLLLRNCFVGYVYEDVRHLMNFGLNAVHTKFSANTKALCFCIMMTKMIVMMMIVCHNVIL